LSYPQPIRRTGLGRRFAEIVGPAGPNGAAELTRLLSGPAVVPLDAVPVAMLVADRSGRVRAANARWTALSGLDATSSLGSGWLAAIREEQRASLQAAVDQVAAGGPPRRLCRRWGPAGGGAAIISLSSVEQAGDRLIGIAVEPAPGRPAPLGEEVIGLLRSVDALMETLDRVVARLQPAGPGAVGASRPRTARTSAAYAG
jgi:PAS domain-containing protein